MSLCLICPISSYYLPSFFISVILSLYLTSPANLVSLHLLCPVFSSYLSSLFSYPISSSYLSCPVVLPSLFLHLTCHIFYYLSYTCLISKSDLSCLFISPIPALCLTCLVSSSSDSEPFGIICNAKITLK